jgi:hypothetical protein
MLNKLFSKEGFTINDKLTTYFVPECGSCKCGRCHCKNKCCKNKNKINPIVEFSCGICLTSTSTLSSSLLNHQKHIQTESHQKFKELFKFELLELNESTLQYKYSSKSVDDIIQQYETVYHKYN